MRSDYDYDDAGRLLSVQHSGWLDWVLAFVYTVDPAGNHTAVGERVAVFTSYYPHAVGRPGLPAGEGTVLTPAAIEPGEQTISYTYDAASRA